MQDLATIFKPSGAWRDWPCFVVGGGPSLKGFPWESLRGLPWIGVNMAIEHRPPIWFFSDHWIAEELLKPPPERMESFRRLPAWDRLQSIRVCSQAVMEAGKSFPDTFYVRVAPPRVLWGKDLKQGIGAFTNSGLSAVNLADALGADPIYLLGFDMNSTGDPSVRLSHYHKFYPPERTSSEYAATRFLAAFEHHARFVRAKVFNCSPRSALGIFPKVTAEEALRLAREKLKVQTSCA